MRPYRFLLLFLALGCFAALPLTSFAAVSDFFGPIIEKDLQTCAIGWGGLVVTINNLIKFFLSITVLVAVLTAVYGGILLVLNAASPENRSKAKGLLINAAIGLLLALAAWLIVNTMLGVLTGGKTIGTFTGFLSGGDMCIQPIGQTGPTGTGGLNGTSGTTGGGVSDGSFSYDSAAVRAEAPAAAAALSNLLSCMADKLPGNTDRISALTDTYVGTDSAKIAYCAKNGSGGDPACKHEANSCHYGGSCGSNAYAVDFGNEENKTAIRAAAKACDPKARWNDEGDHVHISVGAESGCGCDTRMSAI